MSNLITCPCGSLKPFSACCHPYISGKTLPQTPEALMRSRYTAYTLANIGYIEQTMQGPAARGFDPQAAEQWARQADWLDLTVLNSSKVKRGKGFVEFIARYRMGGLERQIHEKSEFQYVGGRWYYISGI